MSSVTKRIGILGSGQLGRMLALAAAPLGIECRFYDSSPGTPCASLGTSVVGSFSDRAALTDFARACDVVTYEFENVPVDAVKIIGELVSVYPPPRALEVAADRGIEKAFFNELGIPTARFRTVESQQMLLEAVSAVGVPCVVKTCRLGYDGKGQRVIRSVTDAEGVFEELGCVPLIVEQFVTFERELSVVAVRSVDGVVGVYPLVHNEHREGILLRSELPARDVSPQVAEQARAFASKTLEALQYVGVLAIEFFQCCDTLVANEMAPRVHNSGHATIDGSVCSQFENHIRAVAGLPLGSTATRQRTVMVNIIGVEATVPALAQLPTLKLHLYGKDARPNRKVGHVNLLDPSSTEEEEVVRLLYGK